MKERAEYAEKLKNTQAEKEIKSIIEVERQRDQSIRVNKVLRPRHAGGPNNILIPAKTEYDNNDGVDFDHLNIDQIWERIE